jgi:hypothetical protein
MPSAISRYQLSVIDSPAQRCNSAIGDTGVRTGDCRTNPPKIEEKSAAKPLVVIGYLD